MFNYIYKCVYINYLVKACVTKELESFKIPKSITMHQNSFFVKKCTCAFLWIFFFNLEIIVSHQIRRDVLCKVVCLGIFSDWILLQEILPTERPHILRPFVLKLSDDSGDRLTVAALADPTRRFSGALLRNYVCSVLSVCGREFHVWLSRRRSSVLLPTDLAQIHVHITAQVHR